MPDNLKTGSSTIELWTDLRGLLESAYRAKERYPDFDTDAAETDDLFKELDAYGDAWRYPFDRKNEPFLKDIISISITSFQKRCQSVSGFLGVWEEMFTNEFHK